MLRGQSVRWALEAVSVADGTVHEIHSSPYKLGLVKIPEGGDLVDMAVIPVTRSRVTSPSPGMEHGWQFFTVSLDDPAAVAEKLAVMPADGRLPVRVFRTSGKISTLRWSPDGFAIQASRILRGNATNIWEKPPDGGEPKQLQFRPNL